ncbi:MAG: GTP 3',8-cyclase MoaA, partial [Planctomycetota bacterium]|nr:GTP 3',8-cyclase MoaA [Planctomycetota bacterium]
RLGRRLRDLRISVTDRCNFRCPYCMPAEVFGDRYRFLPKPQILTFEEIERIARAAVRLGVEKLRITGGEPLLRSDLPGLVRRLAAIPGLLDLSLTTNGFMLAGFAGSLREAGLSRVTISLASLDEGVFRAMSGRRTSLAPVLAGLEAAERAGLGPIKLNCVVKRGVNDHTIVALARHFRGTGHIVRFIEFMDVGTLNGWRLDDVVSKREILDRIGAEFPLEPVAPNYAGEVATRFRYRDGQGEIGIIASVTEPFCGACSRARLSPEGKLVTCLFAADGHDLRAFVRSDVTDADIEARLATIWGGRTNRYSEQRTSETAGTRKLEMYHLGG